MVREHVTAPTRVTTWRKGHSWWSYNGCVIHGTIKSQRNRLSDTLILNIGFRYKQATRIWYIVGITAVCIQFTVALHTRYFFDYSTVRTQMTEMKFSRNLTAIVFFGRPIHMMKKCQRVWNSINSSLSYSNFASACFSSPAIFQTIFPGFITIKGAPWLHFQSFP